MTKPPAQIDGFAVVEYGFLHEPALPVGYQPPKGSGRVLEPMQNFAVCTSEGVDGFYLLCCTSSWAYMTYSYSELKQEAKEQVGVEFGKHIELCGPAPASLAGPLNSNVEHHKHAIFMPIVSDSDAISYVIVVRGLSEAGNDIFCSRFPQHRGGVNPRLSETYLSVECQLSDVCGNLDWIAEHLATRYRTIELGIAIYTPRNWSNYDIPPEVISAAQNGAVSLRVMFSSPVVSKLGAPA